MVRGLGRSGLLASAHLRVISSSTGAPARRASIILSGSKQTPTGFLVEFRAGHVGVGIVDAWKVVDLHLDGVAIWIVVVDRRGDPVLDRYQRIDPLRSQVGVAVEEVVESVKGVGDVVQAGSGRGVGLQPSRAETETRLDDALRRR